ncbi:MAG: HEPN domain-containing protein [Pseudomonadota bacterium]
MSRAKTTFEGSIKDAEILLGYFDDLPRPLSDDAEVLKRAGLVMALTAWETYIEDLVLEEVTARIRVVNGSHIGKFVMRRLEEELRRLHNPTSEKVRKIFNDFLEVDVTAKWEWQGYDAPKARKTLDELLSKRGDVVHRSKPSVSGVPAPHVVKRDDLDKYIRFLKGLVAATDKVLIEE